MIYAGSRYDGVFAEFQKRFPDIKVTYVIGPSSGNGQRIMAERRAGKPIADLYTGAVSVTYNVLYKGKAFAPMRPQLILPEVLDKSNWWKGKHKYLDDESKYVFVFNAQAAPYFIYNSKLVNPRELKSYWDLLDPKWKGKLLMVDPTSTPAGNGLRFVFYNPDLGPKFLRRLLTEMEPGASRDSRQIIDWLAVGKYAIGVFTNPSRLRVPAAKQQGLPIDNFKTTHFKEGVLLASVTGNVGFLDKAPHPNAARVMLNWLLSREGQLAYQKYVIADSLRIDISKDEVPPGIRRFGRS
jgi:ABC-type Fe3+ transport system substrate-binding protein